MKKIGMFLFLALSLLIFSGQASAETFASVPLYISGEPEGLLSIDEPTGSNVESVSIASNEQDQQGVFKEIGRWSTGILDVSSNISGAWSGESWVSSNRDATVTIRYTIIQDEVNLDSFEFEGVVAAGDSIELAGSSDFQLTGLDTSPLILLVESSWTAQAGTPPPGDNDGDGLPDNTSIVMEYASSSRDTGVELSISHVQIRSGSEPYVSEGQSEVTIYVKVYDVFGIEETLSSSKGSYELSMGPRDESLWEATVDSVSEKSNYLEVQFIWSYEGKSLPSGDNDYDVNIKASDTLSNEDWSKNMLLSIYITPKPDVEIDSVSSVSKKVVIGGTATYTLSVTNTGSGADDFIVTTTYENDWDISIDYTDFNLEPGESKTLQVSVSPQDSVPNGQELSKPVIVTAASDSTIKDSTTLITKAEEAKPDWDFSVDIVELGNDNFVEGTFIIKDRVPIEIHFLITNEGNSENNYNLEGSSQDNAFAYSFEPGFVSSLSPEQSVEVIVTLTPKTDYFGTSTLVEIEVTSAGNNYKESATLSVDFQQSGLINLRDSNLQLSSPVGSASSYVFDVSNLDINEPKRIYFEISGMSDIDQLAKDWFTFFDKDGKQISYGSFKTLFPSEKSVEITIRVNVPANSDIEMYNLKLEMMNENRLRISESYSFEMRTLEAVEEETSNMMVYGGVFVFGILAAAYIYRNFSDFGEDYDEDYDDDDTYYEDIDDFDNTVQPAPVQNAEVPQVQVVESQVPLQVSEVAEPSLMVPSLEVQPEIKTRRKWFGLFGPKVPVDLPVAAEPVVVQPVAAEPVVAQPVVAEPVVAQPVVAEPVVAQAVVVPDPEEES